MRRNSIRFASGNGAGLLVVFCLAVWPAFCNAAPASVAKRAPNFVYLFADDQRWDALGVVQREQGAAGRFPWLSTPNLDRIASGGVRFRNAFVVNALCAPSRASLVTGQYGHVNGVTNNHTPHAKENISVAALLRPAGYVSGYATSAAVFGVPNDDLGEEVKAVVQVMPGITPDASLAAELIAFCQQHLARPKCPRSIDFLDALPRLPTGKLYKKPLRETYWAGRANRIV